MIFPCHLQKVEQCIAFCLDFLILICECVNAHCFIDHFSCKLWLVGCLWAIGDNLCRFFTSKMPFLSLNQQQYYYYYNSVRALTRNVIVARHRWRTMLLDNKVHCQLDLMENSMPLLGTLLQLHGFTVLYDRPSDKEKLTKFCSNI